MTFRVLGTTTRSMSSIGMAPSKGVSPMTRAPVKPGKGKCFGLKRQQFIEAQGAPLAYRRKTTLLEQSPSPV